MTYDMMLLRQQSI